LTYPTDKNDDSERRGRPFSWYLIDHPWSQLAWGLLGLSIALWARNVMAILGWVAATCGALRLASRDGYGVRVTVLAYWRRWRDSESDLARH
jgi:hypothetical protein